jgi:hypothetical protein
MKRFLALVVTAGLAVALYAATATGGQQAVTPKQFAALKKQVTTLQTRTKRLEDFAGALVFCIGRAVPVNTLPNWHTTGAGETQEMWALATTEPDCATAFNTPAALKQLTRLSH